MLAEYRLKIIVAIVVIIIIAVFSMDPIAQDPGTITSPISAA